MITMASASKSHFLLFPILFFVTILSSNAATQDKPQAFHIPIKKDTQTLQYSASFQIGTPPNDIEAVIDLQAPFLSFACKNYKSSTYHSTPCRSNKCKTTCSSSSNDTCPLSSFNPFNKYSVLPGHQSDDVVTVHSTDGTAALISTYSTHLDFSCVDSKSLKGLAKGTNGILGLTRTQMSLPLRLSSAFNIAPRFALCLPSSNEFGFGDLFIGGGGPYMFPGGHDASQWLVYTPLSDDYSISVKTIKIDRRVVSLDSSLLSINVKAKLSTSTPYGVLQSSIYKAVVYDFVKRAAARNITRVAAVKPFGACFSTKNVHWTKAGPRVPVIDLELEGNMVSVDWRIHGANSMVSVNKNTLCLGFVDGGLKARSSIVLGGNQLEDNFLQFDLSTSRLGFTSSILPHGAKCSNFRNL